MGASGRPPLLRVAVVGATGLVGSELIEQLEARRFPLQELRAFATDESLGATVEWLGHELAVESEPASLRGLDLVFLCTPRAAALDWIRLALRDEVPCLDLSGALADRAEVPLVAAALGPGPEALRAPVLALPVPAALAASLFLAPLAREAGIARLALTVVESASATGRGGVAALEGETVALFNQQEAPEPGPQGRGIAFDCLPASGALGADRASDAERAVARDVARLLHVAPPLVSVLRIPTFAGSGVQLLADTERAVEAERCEDLVAETDGLVLAAAGAAPPTTRDAVGSERVHVGRLRAEGTRVLAWIAFEPVRLAVDNALRVAALRLASRG